MEADELFCGSSTAPPVLFMDKEAVAVIPKDALVYKVAEKGEDIMKDKIIEELKCALEDRDSRIEELRARLNNWSEGIKNALSK